MDSFQNEIEHQFICEWKFKKGDFLYLKNCDDTNYSCVGGKSFYATNIPGLLYFIKVCPYGHKEEGDELGLVTLYLTVNGSSERKIKANITFFIDSVNYSCTFEHDYEKLQNWGEICCKTSEFFDSNNKYFVDGEITVKVEGTFKTERSLISKVGYPISMQWKIKEEDLKAINESKNGYLNSKRKQSTVNYYLSIYPNETRDDNRSQTWVYLNIERGNEKKIEAVFDLYIKSVNLSLCLEDVYEKKNLGWGRRVCYTDEFFDQTERYIVDGFLTINLNGILMIEEKHDDLKVTDELNKSLESKRARVEFHSENGILPSDIQQERDFTIVIADQNIKVQKQVLMDASPVWKAMFDSKMKESIENKIIIKEYSFKIVEAVMKLLYGSDMTQTFSFDETLTLYQFAEQYQIKNIMDLTEDCLVKKISPANVVQLIEFSKNFNATKLYQCCTSFLLKCSEEHTPVYGANSLDKDLIVSMFLSSLSPIIDTEEKKN